jgi:hypothetical protein
MAKMTPLTQGHFCSSLHQTDSTVFRPQSGDLSDDRIIKRRCGIMLLRKTNADLWPKAEEWFGVAGVFFSHSLPLRQMTYAFAGGAGS